MWKFVGIVVIVGGASACGDESCFPEGSFDVDVTGTFQIDATAEAPPCRPAGEFLALPDPIHTTIDAAGTWTFDDDSLSVVLYPEDCLFTLIQGFDGTDQVMGAYRDQLSYIALTQPAPDTWTGAGVLRRQYDAGGMCENRIASVNVTMTPR